MNQEQASSSCEYFDSPKCPYRNEELMKGLIDGLDIRHRKVLDHSKGEEVNKTFCNTCGSYKKDNIDDFISGAKAESQKPVKTEDYVEGDSTEWRKPVESESQKDSDTETQSIDGRVQELEGRVQELEEIVRELLTNQI